MVHRLGVAFHINREVGLLGIQRNRIGDGGIRYAGDAAGSLQQAVVESDTGRPLRAKGRVRTDAHRQDLLRLKARVHFGQGVQALDQTVPR